jgi:shikimate 5-dehydrogenase
MRVRDAQTAERAMLARAILAAMHLVAVACSDPDLAFALRGFRDPERRFHLHPVAPTSVTALIEALRVLDFAGALLLDPRLQRDAARVVERTSLDARELGVVDALVATPAGVVGDVHLGRAVGAALRGRLWDARGARAVLLGADLQARAVARELATLGIAHLTVLAAERPDAERAVARLAASATVDARAYADPAAVPQLEQADLIVRTDPEADLPAALFGPHLTVVDLVPGAMTAWRRRAVDVGALSLSARDVQAHVLHAALGSVLGAGLPVEPLLALLHEG